MTQPDVTPGSPPSDSGELLEASWTDRGRAVRGRELGLELLMTSGFVACLAALIAIAQPGEAPHPVAWAVVVAYAIAARTDFPIGSGHVVPTQLFLVPLFALAPAQLVPALVFVGLAVGVAGEAALGRTRSDRLVYCGGDAMHSLGPALVLCMFAGGDGFAAGPEVLLLAFAAQLAFDFASSSLHDLLVFGTRPKLHARVLVWVWGVDAALAPLGLMAAEATLLVPLAGLAALPLVALLSALSADRSRRIDHAHERLEALNRERRRREAAVQRVGDALASNLDIAALMDVVGRAAVEALEGEAGRAREAVRAHASGDVVGPPGAAALLDEVEVLALAASGEVAALERGGYFALAGVIGDIGVISVARSTPFEPEERSLLAHLCTQAAASAANLVGHQRLRDAEARLRHQAFHDGLTGLANRALFSDRVAHALQRTVRDPQPLGVLYIDLDGFKLVNDTLGHDAGDELLVVAAERIRSCLRTEDTAARLGGDEFAVLLEDLPEPGEAEAVAERLRVALRAPVPIREREFVVRASIGIALPAPGADPESVLRQADLAMYSAKSRGGDRVEPFRAEMLASADTRTELANDLSRAVERGEIELHFQPIYDLETDRPHAVEALARWRHPRRGLLAPAAFIPLAEERGLIDTLGRFIVDEACRVAAGWHGGEHGPPKVTVNVSSAQLRMATFAGFVAGTLRSHGLESDRLMLEVTESVAVATDSETQATLDALGRLGVGLALDDFGTGFSSLSYLARTKVDLLKLDRAFLADVEQDAVQARLVAGVMQLAQSLGVPVVAEGIERPAQLERVRAMGGRYGQGYLFGKPVDAATFARQFDPPPAVAQAPLPLVLAAVGEPAGIGEAAAAGAADQIDDPGGGDERPEPAGAVGAATQRIDDRAA
jgi:diguanylate cyclase (GGDEF)-like protein